jgi:coenzyme F420-0:L-glutamate ligase / coenzyme F420-1:gamma-L-glutamate ligase
MGRERGARQPVAAVGGRKAARLLPRDIEKTLTLARVARLATLDGAGRPHIVSVCFVYDGEAFYTAIDRKPKRVPPARLTRVRNIRMRPRVALLIDHYDEDWSQLWYVLIRGTARLVPKSAHAERARVLRRLRRKYPQYVGAMLPHDAPIIRIRQERATSWGKI